MLLGKNVDEDDQMKAETSRLEEVVHKAMLAMKESQEAQTKKVEELFTAKEKKEMQEKEAKEKAERD